MPLCHVIYNFKDALQTSEIFIARLHCSNIQIFPFHVCFVWSESLGKIRLKSPLSATCELHNLHALVTGWRVLRVDQPLMHIVSIYIADVTWAVFMSFVPVRVNKSFCRHATALHLCWIWLIYRVMSISSVVLCEMKWKLRAKSKWVKAGMLRCARRNNNYF